MGNGMKVILLSAVILYVWPSLGETPIPQFGVEDYASFTAPSKMWVKSAMKETPLPQKYGNTVEGVGKSQIFLRYAQVEVPFIIGTIHYHSFPYSKHPKNDTPEAVKEAFTKMHHLTWVGERHVDEHTWIFQGPERQGPRYFRLYFTKGKNSYAISTAILRNAYVETTQAESEWIQIKIMQRHLQQEGMQKTTSTSTQEFFNKIHQQFKNAILDLEIIPTANAQTPVANCPPPNPSGGTPVAACPSATTCAGMFPTAQMVCLANVASCQQGNLTTMFNNANGTATGFRQDINCESNKWGAKVDDIKTWLDQKIAGEEPRVDRLLGQIDRGLDIADKLVDPVHMAGVAALGAMASTLATGAIGLLAQGIGEGLSYLYKELSGQNEEELMRKRAEAFAKAKEDWEKLNGDLTKLEESIDTSIELFEVIKASGMGLEDFMKNTQDQLKKKNQEASRLKFRIDKLQHDYAQNENEGTMQCMVALDQKKKEAEAEITRLTTLGDELSRFKKKNNNYEFACQNLSREIGLLLAKEAVIEKARTNMGLYFAAHLWQEQKDAEKLAAEQRALVPMETYKKEKKLAQEEFYTRLFPPVINTQEREVVNCKKVLRNLADKCAEQFLHWYDYIPFVPTKIAPYRKCAAFALDAHYRPNMETTPWRNVEPSHYAYFLGTYAKNLLTTGEIYRKVDNEYEAKCVRLAVDNYNSYAARADQVEANYKVDLATWNHRLVNFNTYYQETSEMINTIKVESACGNIAETGCYEGETDCQKLKDDSCVKNIKRVSCSQHTPGDCPVPTVACRDPNDPSDYCKYQRETIEKCKNFEKTCTAFDYPMGCNKSFETECRKFCEDILAKCRNYSAEGYRTADECNQKLAPKVTKCESEEKACFNSKGKCMKSSFSNARFRFERFKTMRKYLDDNLCHDFPKAKSMVRR